MNISIFNHTEKHASKDCCTVLIPQLIHVIFCYFQSVTARCKFSTSLVFQYLFILNSLTKKWHYNGQKFDWRSQN